MPSKARRWGFWVLGAGLMLLGIGWWGRARRAEPPLAPHPLALKAAVPKPRLASPLQLPLPAPPLKPERACASFWEALRRIDVRDLDSTPQSLLDLPKSGECQHVPAELAFWHERFRQTCEKLTREELEKTKQGEDTGRHLDEDCFVSVATYRAYITDWMTRDEPLSQIGDARVLADKLMVAYLSPTMELDERGATPMAAIASRLLDLDPHSTSAAKAFLTALADDGIHRMSDGLWQKAEDALSLTEAADPDLPGLEEIGRWVKSRGREAREVPGTVLQRLGGFSFLDFYSE